MKISKVKLFRYIYYAVIAVIAVVFFSLTLANVGGGAGFAFGTDQIEASKSFIHNAAEKPRSASIYDLEHYQRADIVEKVLTKGGFTRVDDGDRTADNAVTFTPKISAGGPSVVRMSMRLSGEERRILEKKRTGTEPKEYYNDVLLNNIAAYVPASKNPTGKVVMMTVHYDSNGVGAGMNGTLVPVAALLETAKQVAKSRADLSNDFLFLFADGGAVGALGTYAFTQQFKGFATGADAKSAYERVGVALSFDARGTDGAVTLAGSSSKNSKLLAAAGKALKQNLGSGVDVALSSAANGRSNLSVLGQQVPTLEFTNHGKNRDAGTQNDAVISDRLLKNYGTAMQGLSNYFGTANLEVLGDGSRGVFFSYLGGTVSYPVAVAYVLGSLILCAVIVALVLGKLRGTLKLGGVLKGIGVSFLTLALSLAFGYAAYYAVGAILSICGVVNIHTLSSVLYSSPALTVFACMLVVAFSVGAQLFCKRLFVVRAGDVVTGNIVLWGIVGGIFSLAVPALSPVIQWVGMFAAAILLVTTLLKPLYKKKTAEDMDRLFLPILPVVFLLPMIMAPILTVGLLAGASYYPLLCLFPVLVSLFITPYADYMVPGIDRLVKKLPGVSIREVETVTVTVGQLRKEGTAEAKATLANPKYAAVVKKGDAGEITYQKKSRRFEKINYKNWHGVTVFCAGAVIVLFALTGHQPAFSSQIGARSFDRAYEDDAVVYVVDKTGNAANERYWMISDVDAFTSLKQDGKLKEALKWDKSIGNGGAYKLIDSENSKVVDELLPTASPETSSDSSKTEKKFKVSLGSTLRYSLSFSKTDLIESVKIDSLLNTSQGIHTRSSFTVVPKHENADEILQIVDLFGETTVTIKLRSGDSYSGSVTFSGKKIADKSNADELNSLTGLWSELNAVPGVRIGFQIKNYTLSI